MVAIQQTSLDYVFNQLLINLFGSPMLLGLFLIVVGAIACMANGFDLQATFLLLTPLIIATIVAGFLPTILWALIIFGVCFLWIYVAWKIVGAIR